VARAIEEAIAARARRAEITADWVLSKLAENAAKAAQEVPVLDREGNPTGFYVYQGAVVNRALELLGKHLGMFPDRQLVGGDPTAPPITHAVEHMTVDQRRQRLGELLAAARARALPRLGYNGDGGDHNEHVHDGAGGVDDGR
jgi:hypothetical protein